MKGKESVPKISELVAKINSLSPDKRTRENIEKILDQEGLGGKIPHVTVVGPNQNSVNKDLLEKIQSELMPNLVKVSTVNLGYEIGAKIAPDAICRCGCGCHGGDGGGGGGT